MLHLNLFEGLLFSLVDLKKNADLLKSVVRRVTNNNASLRTT